MRNTARFLQPGIPYDALSLPQHVSAYQKSRISIVEWLLGGAFFLCPITAWILIPGILSWSDAFLLSAMSLLAVRSALHKTNLRVPVFIFVSAVFLITPGLISFLNNTGAQHLINWLKFLISLFVIPVFIMWITSEKSERIDRMLWFWLAGTCLSALVAVLGKYGLFLPFLHDKSMDFGGRPSGLTFHANSLAYTCALLIPVATYLAATASTKAARWASIAAIALLADGILVSGSRGSLLAALVGSLVWLPNPFKRIVSRSNLVILAAETLAVVLVTIFILWSDNPFEDSTSAFSRLLGQSGQVQKSNDARHTAAQNAYDKFEAAPIFGQGFDDIRFSHNGGLQILQCSGIVGAAGALLWWAGMINCWLWLRLRGSIPKWNVYKEILLLQMFQAVALTVIVNGIFEPFLTDRNGYFPFGLMLGFWLSAKMHNDRQDSITAIPPRSKFGKITSQSNAMSPL